MLALPGWGFTLLGPRTAWQTDLLSYDVNQPIGGLGPMNIGEEYRWNVPTVYYGFTTDFLNYFGARGAQEVDKAIAILNALPSISDVDINDYPVGSLRVNHRAQALGLTDLKSFVLQNVLYELGVGDPTRYVYCIRNRWLPTDTCPPIAYHVIKRNFDPTTLSHSSYINGDLWTYTSIQDSCDDPKAWLSPEPVDPMAVYGYRHAPVSSQLPMFLYGGFFTTLTRDDVAALKYIYRRANYNVENIPVGVTGGTNALLFGDGSPWGIPPYFLTNGYITNATGGGTNAFIEPALRGGIQKIQFVRTDYDSIIGAFYTAITNAYTEVVYTNSRPVTHYIERFVAVPDLLFDAGDLQDADTFDLGVVRSGRIILTWDNNDDINGIGTGSGGVAAQGGPGTIGPGQGTAPAMILTLNNVGPIWGNFWPTVLSEADANQPNQYLLWGSFDGSTNAPIVYPVGTSIYEIEAMVLGR